jgi:rhodanese-related sulfurtransferase
MGRFALLSLGVFLSLGLKSIAGEVSLVTPQEATRLVAEGKAVLLDVREKEETAGGILDGAIWIATSALEADDSKALKKLEALDKSKELLVYCRSGGRSARMASKLALSGFKTRNLRGYADAVSAGMKTSKPKAP